MTEIRKMTSADSAEVLEMMRVFYASPAVSTNGSDEIFRADIAECVGDSPFAEGMIFAEGESVLGYAMLAKSFSTEFGKPCVWIEDLYIKPEYRSRGIGTAFFAELERRFPTSLLRLEVEEENRAIHVYRRCGFEVLPYTEMKKSLPTEVTKEP